MKRLIFFVICLQHGHAAPDVGEVAGEAEGVGHALHRPDGQQDQSDRSPKVIQVI